MRNDAPYAPQCISKKAALNELRDYFFYVFYNVWAIAVVMGYLAEDVVDRDWPKTMQQVLAACQIVSTDYTVYREAMFSGFSLLLAPVILNTSEGKFLTIFSQVKLNKVQ